MSKNILLKKIACVFLCLSLFGNVSIAQKNYGSASAETEVRNYFNLHAAQYRLSAGDLTNLKITSDYVDESIGIRHIYVQQQVNGLDVVNAIATLHLKKDGTAAHATYQFAKLNSVGTNSNSLTATDAVRKAMADVKMPVVQTLQVKETTSGNDQKTVFKAAGTTWDIPVRKAYLLNDKNNSVVAVWEVQLYRREQSNYWIMYLDAATGEVIVKHDMVVKCDFGHPHLETDEHLNDNVTTPSGKLPTITLTPKNTATGENVYRTGIAPNTKIDLVEDMPTNGVAAGIVNSYRVYDAPYEAPNHPGATHSLKATGGDALASPDGWHKVNNAAAFQFTNGNNVWAFQDPSPGPLGGVPSADPTRTAYNNGGLMGTPTLVEPFLFNYNVNLNADPTTYQNAAIVNLFYWNNLMHDVFYQFGFNEASRNFQASHNFSTGNNRGNTPLGQNDAVLAQAQDGGGTNNANFLTLADGVAGQMQMYLWTGSTPDSIVQIVSNTMPPPAAGKKYFSIQGALGNAAIANNDLFTNPILNRPYIIVQKNAAGIGTSSQGCGTGQMGVGLPPANDVNGKIVLIDRGGCSFGEKVLGAQLGGAVGVIVINNVPGAEPIAMGGADAPANAIIIPSVMVTFEAGKEIKDALVRGAAIVGSLRKTVGSFRRDGDLDNGVIAHEYGHGISTRLAAGGPNPTGRLGGDEQGGEGWSDNFALYMTTTQAELLPATAAHPNGILPNRGIGSYVVYQPHVSGGGIRPTQYSIDMNVNPVTYSFIKNPVYTIPHGIGYIWCTMLYEMQQSLIDIYGFNNNIYNSANPTVTKEVPAGAGGNNVAMRLVIEGLKLQPANPTFVQERDAILKADTLLYNGRHACALWKAFAKRGLGFSAVAGTNALGDEVEQFNENPICNPQAILAIKKTGESIKNNGLEINYTIVATNVSPAELTAANVIVTDTLPPFVTYVSSDGGTLNGRVVSWPAVSLARNATVTHTVKVTAAHPTPAVLVLNEDHEGAMDKFNSPAMGTQRFNLISTGAFSGTKVWFVEDYDIPGSNVTLNLTAPIIIPASGALLIFNHRYATESEYDGGVVEVSVDNVNWTYLNTFSQNGYNGTIPTTNNPLIGATNLAAFTGSSPGYIQSIASLNAFAGQTIYFRFRFTSDPAGGSVAGGGWWVDDVLLATGNAFVSNIATANATNASSKVTSSVTTLITTPSGQLPIEGLQELKATVKNKKIVLNWETMFENNNRGFEVMRKAPADADFTSVGFVNGAGNSTAKLPYSFTDVSAAKGIVYLYKLKQINFANRLQYSNTVNARITDQQFAFTFSPNPARSSVTFSINNDDRADVSITINDVSGRTIKTIKAGNESYINTTMRLDKFAKGVYLVSVRSGDNYQTQKLVVE